MAKPKNDQFQYGKSAESQFYRALRKVARKSGHIIEIHADGASLSNERMVMETLTRYSKQLEPWARRQAEKMLERVSRKNKTAYKEKSKEMGKLLREGVALNDERDVAMALLHSQVALIQSIPLEAGIRAQEIAAKNFLEGRRAVPDQATIEQLQREMGMSTEVATNRARLIARTETAKANSAFVQARAESVESEGYFWRTTLDGAERPSHKAMNGKFIRWDDPPTLNDGTVGHAGTFPNCRCFADPVLPPNVE